MNAGGSRDARSARRAAGAAFVACVLLAAACAADAGETGGVASASPDGTAPIPGVVRAELVTMGEEDQEIRSGMTAASFEDAEFMAEMVRGDSARSLRLQQIVEEYGWPDRQRAGDDAASAAFLILQHTPFIEYRRELLPRLEPLARQGAIRPDEFALLTDRTLMHDGLPQRYGSQFNFVDGRSELYEVEDEARLDERRLEMGLMPMAEYRRLIEEMYGR